MELVNCNLCGEDSSEPLFRGKDRRYRRPGEFGIVRCRKCGLVYTNPRPSTQEMPQFYPAGLYGSHLQYSKSTYPAFVYAADKFYGTSSKLKQIPFGHRLVGHMLRRQVRGIPRFIPGGRILDVGCANGRMVRLLQDIGWDAEGVEISEWVTKQATQTGIRIHCGSFLDIFLPEGSYDAIRFWHVLEHLPDPRQAIQKGWALLKDRGHLILGLPNFESWQRRLFGPYWRNLDAPRHLYHFTPITITRMLAENRFEPVKVRFTNLSHGFIGSLEHLVLEKLRLQPCGSWVESWRYANWLFAVPFDMLLDFFLRGDFMEIQARKVTG